MGKFRRIARSLASAAAMSLMLPAPSVSKGPNALVKATATVAASDGPLVAELRFRGGDPDLRLARPSRPSGTTPLWFQPPVVLRLLADRRFEALWPVLIAWAGPALETERAKMIEAAEVGSHVLYASRTTGESIARRPTRALLQRTDLLAAAGRKEEAIAAVRQALTAMPATSGRDRFERALIATRLAAMLVDAGQLDDALAVLDDAASLADERDIINLGINRAAFLAEGGRYAEALAMIDETALRTDKVGVVNLRYGAFRVPGSDRHFAWIRACALKGIGRDREVRETVAPALRTTEPNRLLFVTEANAQVRLRAWACMRDVDGMVNEILADVRAGIDPDNGALLLLEPDYAPPRFDPAFLRQVRADPRLATVTRDVLRVLPRELTPALNEWRSIDTARTPSP